MRIIIVTAYFPPHPSAGANRLSSFARGLRDKKAEVTVFAPHFDNEALTPLDEDLTSITHWVPAKSVNRGSFVSRFLDEAFISWSLLREAKKAHCDACLLSTPFIGLTLFSIFMVHPSKLVVDIRDLSWEYSVSKNFIVRFAQAAIGVAVRYALRRAALVVVSTEAELSYVSEHLPDGNCILIPNGIEDRFIGSMEALDSSSMLGSGMVTYVGTLGYAQGVIILAKAAEHLPNITFQIAGYGDEFVKIETEIYKNGLTNVELHRWLTRDDTLTLYQASDVLFCRLRPGFASAVPSKVYEYAAVGRPIVYMGSSQDAAWCRLSEFDGTYFVDDEDVDALILVLARALSAPRPNAAFNRTILRQQYTREFQSYKLAEHIRRLTERSPAPRSMESKGL
jgi:glycosyltransferase involved in cell wall biosynthesis